MPLASSLSAAQKRAEVVEMERRQQERRASVMQGRRRRLSLPTTIQSSTVATKSKVDRRRSIRRENSSNSLASANAAASKENADNNTNINHKRTSSNIHCYYSPPETRSAKKKKLELNPAFFDTIKPSSLLSFSPPNQAANEQREIKRLEQAEREREQRIEQARRNGQLVILSPSNRALYLPINAPTLANNSKDGDHDGMDKSVPTSKSLSSSKENEDGIMRDKHEELLQKMSKDMLIMAKNQAEANDKRRLSEVDLLQKVQELITAESQAVIQSAREQTNETLRADLNGLRDKLATEQQQHSVETTRMAMELQQFQQKVEHAQELQLSLQGQIVLLQEEKKELLLSIVSLQSSLDSAKSQLQLDRTTLTELQKQNVSGQKEFSDQLAQYQVTNTELSVQMSELVNSKEKLEQSIVAYQQAITRLEREVIPFLEASLESERDKVARSESDLESHVASLEESQTMIQDLQQQVEQLQRQNEEDRVRFQSLSENSQVEFQTLTATSNEQEQQILALTQALEKLLSELEMTCQIRDNLQAAHNTLLIEQKQLNDALEESMVQVDQTVTENKELEKKLAMALKLLEAAKATVESDEFTKSAVIEKLNDQLKEERKHREEIETYRQQTELQMHEKEKQVTVLEKTLKLTLEERDMARNNMLGFNEREEDLYLKLRESDRIRREMHSRIMQLMGNIRVFVRVRPAMPNEQSIDSPGSGDALNVGVSHKNTNAATSSTTPFSFPGVYDGRRPADGKNQRHVTSSGDDLTKNVIEVMEPYKDRGGLQDRRKKWRFGFDSVFSPAHGQDDVWEATQPMIQCAVDGFNVTIFAYGQTGSGKTYTMLGANGHDGIIGRSIRMLFEKKHEMESMSRDETRVSIVVELLEVYNEKVRDLLTTDKNQDMKVTSNEVVGNISIPTETSEDVMDILNLALTRRCVKATGSNSESSRSHMIFTIHFEVVTKDECNEVNRKGTLHICDLAGSERLSKSGTNNVGGALLEESKNINKSLSVLSNVIERLQAGDANVPFRESKLTFLLKNSLSGKNAKTLAIVCCNPQSSHVNESLCSLRFAEKVNRIELKAASHFTA